MVRSRAMCSAIALEDALSFWNGGRTRMDAFFGLDVQYPHRPPHGDVGGLMQVTLTALHSRMTAFVAETVARACAPQSSVAARIDTLRQLGYADVSQIGTRCVCVPRTLSPTSEVLCSELWTFAMEHKRPATGTLGVLRGLHSQKTTFRAPGNVKRTVVPNQPAATRLAVSHRGAICDSHVVLADVASDVPPHLAQGPSGVVWKQRVEFCNVLRAVRVYPRHIAEEFARCLHNECTVRSVRASSVNVSADVRVVRRMRP